jgi:hypothetical protein
MKKHIAEDLPARKHPQAKLSAQSKPGADAGKDKEKGEKSPEERVRQAVYDIRYRARRENLPLRTAYSQYVQNSSMSEAEKTEVRNKLFGKGGGMQAEDFKMDMKRSASDAMANALFKVFVEKKNETVDIDQLKLELGESSVSTPEYKKYKVRVTDKQSKVTYVRYATREKISQLRAKGLEVEMTEYGTPYEGERTKGEKTAEVLGKRAKKDYDGDGKIESGAKEYRGSVHNAIQRKRGGIPDGKDTSSVKENFFLGEISATANLPQVDSSQSLNPDANQNQIDILPPKVKNKIVVNPSNSILSHNELDGELISETGYSKFLGMLQEKKMTKSEKKKEKKLKAKYDPSEMKASMKKEYGDKKGEQVYFATIRKQAMKEGTDCECGEKEKTNSSKMNSDDPRSIPTKVNMVKNKFRSMGLKMDYEPEGELIDETKLGYSAQKLAMRRRAKGDKEGADRAQRFANKQFMSSDSDLEKQKMKPVRKQQSKQRQERERDEDHPSLSARERNSNLR